MNLPTASRWKIAAGIAVLLWVARPVPGIIAYRLDSQEWMLWWMKIIAPTLAGGGLTMTSPLWWMMLEVPIGCMVGAGMIVDGLKGKTK